MNKKKSIKQRKKRKLRVGRLCVVLLAMAICIGVLITGITFVGNAIGDFLQGLSSDTATSETTKNKTVKDSIIVLDAGHGGYDGGCEYENYNEKTITLEVALKTGKLLEEAGYQVVYTRTTDVALGTDEFEDLSNRVNLGVNSGGDVFVSLHLNITENISERVYGFEVYANEGKQESGVLAEAVIEKFENLQYSTSRGVLDGNGLHLVAENPIPAILVELGFLDDDMDRAYFTSEDGQNHIAKALAEAIISQYT